MDDLQKDLDVIRTALARSFSYNSTTILTTNKPQHDEMRDEHYDGTIERNSDCYQQIVAAPLIVNDVAVDNDGVELTRLREQVAALSSCELDKTRLEVELASKEAALRQYAQAQYILQQQERELQGQLQRTSGTLQERQTELIVWRERHQRLQREAEKLRDELEALAGQCDRLEVAVGELREAVRGAGDENMRLRNALHEIRVECDTLRHRQVEYDAVVLREVTLRNELQALQTASDESREYLIAARTEIEGRRQFWTAVHEEHIALQEAFAAAKETIHMWERRFVLERSIPPLRKNDKNHNSNDNDDELGSQQKQMSTTTRGEMNSSGSSTTTTNEGEREKEKEKEKEEGNNNEAHMAALEAKVIDLALHLREQQETTAAANECYAMLTGTMTQECHELLHARRALAVYKPKVTHLSETNIKLQAELLARESHVEALQETVISLLDEYTEQSLYCYELETQLAVKVTRGGVTPATFSGSNNGASRRSTALHLMQQQQRKPLSFRGGSGLK